MSRKIYQINISQLEPYKPKIKKISLEDVVKELNKSQSFYKYCIKKKDIDLILKKENRKTLTKYGDMLLGFGKKK